MLTQEYIIEVLRNPKKVNFQTDFHEEVREIYEQLEYHFDDDYPKKLLESTRPNEEGWMKMERERVWECPSRVPIKRVENLLSKIRQADDFRINWLENEIETGIAQDNSFRDYCEYKLPVYKSLEDWLFQTFQRFYLSDPNALIWVILGYCRMKGFEVPGAWAEVARSNLCKIDSVTGKVIKNESGKVMKPEGWSAPVLAPFIKL